MENQDKIKELFAEKLGAHEAPVNPELWSSIASKIGSTAVTSTSVGMSVLAKSLIGVGTASIIGLTSYFILQNESISESNSTNTKAELIVENDILKEEENVDSKIVSEKNDVISTKETINTQNNNKQTINSNPEIQQTLKKETTSLSLPNGEKKNSNNSSNQNDNFLSQPFTNQPTPNLIGENPTPIPVKQEKQKVEETTYVASPIKEEKKSTFEITTLPNVYVLNANGYFSIDYSGEYQDFQLTILDDKNNVVFRSTDPDFEWRGEDLYGNKVEPGKYVYILTVKDLNGNPINKYSPLTVFNQ